MIKNISLLPLLNCLITVLVIAVSIVIIWYSLKYFDLNWRLYTPRQSKLAQRIQFGTLLLILPIGYVSLYDLVFSLFVSPKKYYEFVLMAQQNTFSLAWLIVLLNTVLRSGVAIFIASFGIFLEFLQFWIDNGWVKWVAEQYPTHFKEILLEARKERKKWRTTHKTLPDFQSWVRDLSTSRGW